MFSSLASLPIFVRGGWRSGYLTTPQPQWKFLLKSSGQVWRRDGKVTLVKSRDTHFLFVKLILALTCLVKYLLTTWHAFRNMIPGVYSTSEVFSEEKALKKWSTCQLKPTKSYTLSSNNNKFPSLLFIITLFTFTPSLKFGIIVIVYLGY